jgi:hypothetical protein
MTWIDVASDATKIGLGALIAAMSAYLIAHKSQRNEYIKLFLAQKREKLDKCVELLNAFHKKYTHYRADVDTFFINKRLGFPASQAEIDSLGRKGEAFRLAFDSFVDIDGLLLSVGEANANTRLWEYMDTLDEARNLLWHTQTDVATEDIQAMNDVVREKRKQLLLEINTAYEPPR